MAGENRDVRDQGPPFITINLYRTYHL